MENFFGIGSADTFYDKRRHVNVVYYTMMMLRRTKKDSTFMMNLKRILSSGYDKETKSDLICEHILTDLEISYLNYLRGRYTLSEDEYVTILSGEALGQQQIKSPAGYSSNQNWEMIIQMLYATMLSGPSYQGYVQQLVKNYFFPFCSGMRGIKLQSSTFRILSENINRCLELGKTLFSDLPYIEQYVIRAIG